MASLNQIAEKLAFLVNKEQDYYTINALKFSIRTWRAKFIRQESAKGGVSDQFNQTLHVEMILVDINGSSNPTGQQILRSKNKIPYPIRMDSDVDVKYVGTVGGGKSFFQTDWFEIQNYLCMKYMKLKFQYIWDNQYLFVPCNPNDAGWKLLQYLWVIGAFADVEAAVAFFENDSCYSDDMEYPLAEDLIPMIADAIMRGELNANPSNKEIELNPGVDGTTGGTNSANR